MKCGVLSLAVAAVLGGCATNNVAWHDANHLNSQNPPQGISTGEKLPAAETAMSEREDYDINGQTAAAGGAARGGISGAATPAEASEVQFLRGAMSEGMFVVEASEEALRKSPDAHVQAIARQMIADQRRLTEQLSNMAAAKGLEVPKQVNAEQEGMLRELRAATGPAFDQLYIGTLAHASGSMVAKLEFQASYGADPDVRSWADATVPLVQGELVMITTPGAMAPNYATER